MFIVNNKKTKKQNKNNKKNGKKEKEKKGKSSHVRMRTVGLLCCLAESQVQF